MVYWRPGKPQKPLQVIIEHEESDSKEKERDGRQQPIGGVLSRLFGSGSQEIGSRKEGNVAHVAKVANQLEDTSPLDDIELEVNAEPEKVLVKK